MATQSRRVFWIATLFMLVSASAVASDTLKLELEPAYQGNVNLQAAYPIIADIQNLGPDAHGVLSLDGDNGKSVYPVELPRGAHKRILTYPYNGQEAMHFSLDTDQGRVGVDFTPRSGRADGIPVLLITDVPGEMSFIVAQPTPTAPSSGSPSYPPGNQAPVSLVDVYSKPGSVPNRPVGFAGIGKVILGTGSERLSDEQVEALKLWAVTGGTLVFIGGVSAPVLSDTRWADVIPAKDFHVATLAGSDVLRLFPGTDSLRPPTVSVTTGQPTLGAEATKAGSTLLWSESTYGLGRTVYISFNPFEAPVNQFEGRAGALIRILKLDTMIAPTSFLNTFNGNSQPAPGIGFAPAGRSVEDDPFSMSLPPTSRIFSVLAAYFIVVVPINFLVLKKLRRGELAWFTAPVISLVFAGLLFTAAGSLYNAKLSSVSSGLVLGQEGNSEGVFIGKTDLFVPHAGSYDLKLKGVDSLGELPGQNTYGTYGYGRFNNDESEDFDPIDVGEIEVPAMPANNLAFRKMTYRQRIPLSSWFHVKLQPTGDKTARCDIVNSSPFTLKGAQLAVGARLQDLGDLEPGKHISTAVSFDHEAPSGSFGSSDIRMFTLNRPRVALTGHLSGFRPGPQIGEPIPGRSDLDFALFSDWEGASR